MTLPMPAAGDGDIAIGDDKENSGVDVGEDKPPPCEIATELNRINSRPRKEYILLCAFKKKPNR